MELTDDEIRKMRELIAGDSEQMNTVFDMALAHNAAKRQEPVAWVIPGDDNENVNGFIDARISKDGEFTKPLYAAPPDLTAKLAEARELITDWAHASGAKQTDLHSRSIKFLARTK